MIKNSFLLLFLLLFQKTFAQEIWWKETVFYQIYMPSYADSNGDGIGDFKGITSKLDYLESLGIQGIWLTPFLKSPKVDNGYDVANYFSIDDSYGDLDDFKEFLNQAHNRNIKVIMDMVVNHTSTEHFWFQESQKSVDNKYRNYYIWKDQPNNWASFFGGTAWEFYRKTNQYYYHKFDKKMADLNWQNPEVVLEIEKVLKFWLDLGVDGFRLDVINFLTTDGILADNPIENGSQKHLYDIDQPGVSEAMKKIKAVVNQYPNRFVVGEIGSDKIDILAKYQSPEKMDVVFNFNFGSIPEFSSQKIFEELTSMEQKMTGFPTLFFGSHDMPRLMSRLANCNPERASALTVLLFTAKGVPFVYFGEEIGMENIMSENLAEIIDIQAKTQYNIALKNGKSELEALAFANQHNRDKSRSPMQWNSNDYAGFSSSKSWIKIGENYKKVNVKNSIANRNSLYYLYQKLIKIRNNNKVLQYGSYENLTLKNELLFFRRKLKNESVSVFINFGKTTQKMKIPKNATIISGEKTLAENQWLIFSEK